MTDAEAAISASADVNTACCCSNHDMIDRINCDWPRFPQQNFTTFYIEDSRALRFADEITATVIANKKPSCCRETARLSVTRIGNDNNNNTKDRHE